eukprot:scaffold4768_cov412-Prasinococcus_capsulatus_cf.AAC.18
MSRRERVSRRASAGPAIRAGLRESRANPGSVSRPPAHGSSLAARRVFRRRPPLTSAAPRRGGRGGSESGAPRPLLGPKRGPFRAPAWPRRGPRRRGRGEVAGGGGRFVSRRISFFYVGGQRHPRESSTARKGDNADRRATVTPLTGSAGREPCTSSSARGRCAVCHRGVRDYGCVRFKCCWCPRRLPGWHSAQSLSAIN